MGRLCLLWRGLRFHLAHGIRPDAWTRVHIRQTKEHTMYAFMDACVVIFALLNEEASISRLDNCNVQPTCGYIRHLFYLSVVYFLVMGGLDDLVRPPPPSSKNEQSNTSIGLLLCVVALCLVALFMFAIVVWQLENSLAMHTSSCVFVVRRLTLVDLLL